MIALLLLFAFAQASNGAEVRRAKTFDAIKSRPLNELLDQVLKEGRDTTLQPIVQKDVGINEEKPAKRLVRNDDAVSSGTTLGITVAYEEHEGKKKPIALLWDITSTSTKNGKEYWDGWLFRSAINGTLRAAARNGGVDDTVGQRPVPQDDLSRRAFDDLKRALLATPPGRFTQQ